MSIVQQRLKESAGFPRKRKRSPAIAEIAFDSSAREDYLSGFHKRKLQRIKHAKEESAKRDREDKIVARKILRDSRKADLEKHVEAVNVMMPNSRADVAETSDQEDSEGSDHWKDAPQKTAVDHEAEYADEHRYTTVTVEAVDATKDGLRKLADEGTENEAATLAHQDVPRKVEDIKKTKRAWSKQPPITKKKKKFRYESKAERKVTRHKERSGSKVKASLRRS